MPNDRLGERLEGRRWWLATGLVLAAALLATVPTTGDIGLTWDEPAYRYSQLVSIQWWERLAAAPARLGRGAVAVRARYAAVLLALRAARDQLPPSPGRSARLLTYVLFGHWVKDIPARRLASVFEYALTMALGFGFLARRYGAWVGGIAAGALLVMPRVYGDGHIAGTDTPGLLLWAATALAFWKGLHEPAARRWRVAVGVLLGLAFVEKMAAVLVLLPLVGWLVAVHLPRAFRLRSEARADWIDGVLTTLAHPGTAGAGVCGNPPPGGQAPPAGSYEPVPGSPPQPDAGGGPGPALPGLDRPPSARVDLPAAPGLGGGAAALETWASILAFAPLIGWLGNPAWWRETMPRLAHYYLLNTDRQGSLPDIRILYLGQTYEYSLPWHNAWVLIAVTVPAILLAAASWVYLALWRPPAATGCRSIFCFSSSRCRCSGCCRRRHTTAFACSSPRSSSSPRWPVGARSGRPTSWRDRAAAGRMCCAAVLALVVLVPAAWQLIRVHPFELSYYNELIGGPRGAWHRGFELTYWYDAFNDRRSPS